MSRPRIALIAAWDPRDPTLGSGTVYYMSRALQRQVGDVTFLGPIRVWPELMAQVINRIRLSLTGKWYPYIHRLDAAKHYARAFEPRLRSNIDLIVSPMASTQIAMLETRVPIVYTSDTTFHLHNNYYPEFQDLRERYKQEAEQIESLAIQKAGVIPYPSPWAAQSALRDYHASPEKVKVVEWGANLDEVPPRETIEPSKSSTRCELLFLGKDWDRKGGPIAYETTLELRRRGLDARLTVVGCTPPGSFDPKAVVLGGRIDKTDPAQRLRLQKLLLESSFLFQPTRQESLGLAYAEASAHGTPSLATQTGGVAGVVFDGENGFRLPLTATSSDYADLIIKVFSNRAGYLNLVASSRRLYESKLNWDTWATRIGELAAGLAV